MLNYISYSDPHYQKVHITKEGFNPTKQYPLLPFPNERQVHYWPQPLHSSHDKPSTTNNVIRRISCLKNIRAMKTFLLVINPSPRLELISSIKKI